MATPTGGDAIAITEEAHKVAVEIDVSTLSTRLENEALRLIKQFSQQGLEGDELVRAVTEALKELGDGPVQRAARGAASEAFNLGRNLEAQRREVEIKEVVRAEVLDTNTCDACRVLDGNVYKVNTPEYFENMPPAKCHGRELCRGFYLYRAA